MRKLFLDVDGVLADFTTGVCTFLNKPNPYNDLKNRGIYAMEGLLGMTSIEFLNRLDKHFWAGLMPTVDCYDILSMCEQKFGKENICLLTKPTPTPGCLEGKLLWIREWLPEYMEQVLIGSGKHFCASRDAYLIDDHEANCEAFRAHGGNAYLLPALWNSKHNLPRIPNLQHYLETL